MSTYDQAGKKKKYRSPRQVQIEFIENEEVEKLRQLASVEKQSQIVQNIDKIGKK